VVVHGTGNLVKSLSLLEQAREDVYFSQLDRELIEALHRKAQMSGEQGDERTGPGLIAFVDMSELDK